MRYNKGYTPFEYGLILFVFAIAVGGSCGWVMNIVKLIPLDFNALNSQIILRIIGIFMPPLGAVMGYL